MGIAASKCSQCTFCGHRETRPVGNRPHSFREENKADVLHRKYFRSLDELRERFGENVSEEKIIQDDGTVIYKVRTVDNNTIPLDAGCPGNFAKLCSYESIPPASEGRATSSTLSAPRGSAYSKESYGSYGRMSGNSTATELFVDGSGDQISHTRTVETHRVKFQNEEDMKKDMESRRDSQSPVQIDHMTERFVDENGKTVVRTRIVEKKVFSHYGHTQFKKFVADPNFVSRTVTKTAAERETLLHSTRRGYMFRGMSTEDRERVVDSMQDSKVKAGCVIFSEGDPIKSEDGVYILEEGVVDWFFGKRNTDPGMYGKYDKQGQYFGELSALRDENRDRTCVARTSCKIWSISTSVFNNIVRNNAIDEKIRVGSFLREVPLAKSLTSDDFDFLADNSRTVSVRKGDNILSDDDPEVVYIVESGACVAPRDGYATTYSCSDYFGNLTSLNEPHHANRVVAVTQNVELLAIEGKVFKDMFAEEIFIRNSMMDTSQTSEGGFERTSYRQVEEKQEKRVVIKDLCLETPREKTDMERSRLLSYLQNGYAFSGLSEESQKAVVDNMQQGSCLENVVLVEDGKPICDGHAVYILESGLVDAREKNSQDILFTYGEEGHCFGDRSLLSDSDQHFVSKLTMETHTPCQFWYIDDVTLQGVRARDAAITQRSTLNTYFLKNFPPYKLLPCPVFFLSSLRRRVFIQGSPITVQDEVGDDMYFIESGLCNSRCVNRSGTFHAAASRRSLDDARRDTQPGPTFHWKEGERMHKHGEYLGEVSLLFDIPRRASVTATSKEVKTWELSKESFDGVMTIEMLDMLEEEVRRRYQIEENEMRERQSSAIPDIIPRERESQVQKEQRHSVLRLANPGFMFDLLDDDALDSVLAESSWIYHKYPTHSLITLQGRYVEEDGPGLFVLVSGEVLVHSLDQDSFLSHKEHLDKVKVGERTTKGGCCAKDLSDAALEEEYGATLVAYFQQNIFFGPLAGMLQGDRWRWTMMSRGVTPVWYLRRDIFNMYIKEPLTQEIERRRESVRNVRFYQQLPSDERRDCLIEALKRVKFEAGTYLMKFSDQMDRLFIVVSGTAVETLHGETVARFGEGDVIGEQAMLNGKKTKSNDLVAETAMEALVLFRYSFYRKGSSQSKPKSKAKTKAKAKPKSSESSS